MGSSPPRTLANLVRFWLSLLFAVALVALTIGLLLAGLYAYADGLLGRSFLYFVGTLVSALACLLVSFNTLLIYPAPAE